ncbi:hypothetical protein [Streptomyces sp. NPDC058989]|uniref:hypothetical protein n=1 Tax=Streptomyces sp. NPDC058989 TaxID=3346686 RepID=UPI0036C548C4
MAIVITLRVNTAEQVAATGVEADDAAERARLPPRLEPAVVTIAGLTLPGVLTALPRLAEETART